MKIDIRKFEPGDVGWIISKHGEIYTKEFDFDPIFELDIANKFVEILKYGDPYFDTVWVAHINERRAGSIAVSRQADDYAFINFVLVLDEFRGCGIARMLFDRMLQHCTDHQIKLLGLETYSSLQTARKLYRKLGFEITVLNKDKEIYGKQMDQEFWEMKV